MKQKSQTPKFIIGEYIPIKAKPKSSKSQLVWDDKSKIMVAFLHSIPEDGKANDELIKLFKKKLKLKVEIVSGYKSRNKKVKVIQI